MLAKLNNRNHSQSGQALIIILLVMSVVLTVVLSSVSRSITEVGITTYEEDSLRAFSAAEAGVEEKLLNPVFGPGSQVFPAYPDTSVSYKADVTSPIVDEAKFLYPKRLVAGETATFWLVDHDVNGNLTCGATNDCYSGPQYRICWGDPISYSDENLKPAIEVMVYYDTTKKSIIRPGNSANNYENLQVYRRAEDSRWRPNGFVLGDTPNCGIINGQNFLKETRISNDFCGANSAARLGCTVMVSVRMLYSNATYPQPVAIMNLGGGAVKIPSQGILISSTGVAGESSRKVNVFRSHPEPISLLDAAIFSFSGLSK